MEGNYWIGNRHVETAAGLDQQLMKGKDSNSPGGITRLLGKWLAQGFSGADSYLF